MLEKTTDEALADDNSQELWIKNVIVYVEKFLRKHPLETVILQIKSEGGGICTDAVNSQLENNDFYYREEKDINQLALGDVRGKFLVFNRQEGILHGYDYANWTDNTEDTHQKTRAFLLRKIKSKRWSFCPSLFYGDTY